MSSILISKRGDLMSYADNLALRMFRACYSFFFLFVFLAVQPQLAIAQEGVAASESQKINMCASNTSSPRDTLRSFLESVNGAAYNGKGEAGRAGTYRACRHAVETMDFSATFNHSAAAVQIERVLMLKEVLDRVELPPYDQIPGVEDVAASGITQWTIPNTKIRIARIEEGPRAGEFLFSANTVQRLDLYYRQVEQQPYKSTVTAGIYKKVIGDKHTVYNFDNQTRSRLTPVDTSSPKATLESFLNTLNRVYAIIMEVRASHSGMTEAEIQNARHEAEDLFERAVATLDLRKVPEAYREDVGGEAVLLLKEIIDRMLLPPIDFVPDFAEISARRALEEKKKSKAAPIRWRFPNTEIEIVEIMEGKRQGQFLFSAETVSRLKSLYTEMKELPYRPDYLANVVPEEYATSGKTEGFHSLYISTPGVLIPQAHFLSEFVSNLPDWCKALYWDQALWQWIALALSLIVIVLVIYVSFRFVCTRGARGTVLKYWLRLLPPIVIMSSVYVVVHFLVTDINITGRVQTFVMVGGKLIKIVALAWGAFELCRAVAETVITSPCMSGQSANAALFKLGSRIFGILLGCIIVIRGGQRLGVDMLPLLAGLGVGGLAVALAAKHTFANIIGSLILLFNKPVKVGDFCRYGDQIGTVEHIGLISTRIRSLERSVITVPNAEFSEMHLDNYQLRDQRLLKTVLQLRYETTPEQLRWILVKLRELLLSHPKVSPDPARVRFVGYGAFSKDVEIHAYLYCQAQNAFLAIQEDILLRIEDIINESGSGFAFPSQTAYLCRDGGIDEERGRRAAEKVEEWRSNEQLPFPEFTEERRDELMDSLDYPPKGSSEKKLPDGPSEPWTKSKKG